MTLLSVSLAPIAIGLVLLAAIGAVAVGYLVHMRFLRAQVERALAERSYRLALSCPPSEPATQPSAAPVKALGLSFGLPSASRLRAVAAARSQRPFTTADERELRTVAGGGR